MGADDTPQQDKASTRRLGRDTLVYGLAFVASRAASFIMLPIYTRYLTTSDYGTLHLLQMSVDVASILLSAGVVAGVQRYYFKVETESQRRAVLFLSFLMLLGFNMMGTLGLYMFSEPIATLMLKDGGQSELVMIAATSFTLDALITVPMLYLQVQQRSMAYAIASISRLAVQLTLNIVFVVFLLEGVRGILLSTLITNGSVGLVLTVWMLRRTGFSFGRGLGWPLFRFGLPYRFTAAGSFVLTYVDRFFLNESHGLGETGVYSLAYQFGFMLMYLGPAPFHLAWDPQRFQMVRLPKKERDAAYQEGFLYFSVLLVTLAVGISLFVSPVLSLMSDPSYHAAANVVPIIMVGFLCQAWGGVMEFGIQVSERTIWASVATWISVAVIVALYFLLIPPFGMWGAALATIGGFATRWAAFAWFAQRLFPVQYKVTRGLHLALVGGAVVAVGVLMRPNTMALQLASASALTLVYLGLVWALVLQSSERRVVLGFTRKLAGRARALVGGGG